MDVCPAKVCVFSFLRLYCGVFFPVYGHFSGIFCMFVLVIHYVARPILQKYICWFR